MKFNFAEIKSEFMILNNHFPDKVDIYEKAEFTELQIIACEIAMREDVLAVIQIAQEMNTTESAAREKLLAAKRKVDTYFKNVNF